MSTANQTLSSAYQRRNILQAAAQDTFIQTALSAHPFRIAFYMGTGVGKSKTAIECAKWHHDNIQEGGETLIVCHAEVGRDEIWPEELENWAYGHPIQKATRVCYQSLKKFKGRHFTRVILDEAHKITVASGTFFMNNTVDSVIVLTATEPRDPAKKAILKALTGTNTFKVTADEAIDQGIMNDYEVHVFKVKLNEVDKDCKMYGRMMTEKEAYLNYCSWLTSAEQAHMSQKEVYIQMMRFLGNTQTKTLAAHYLLNQLRNRQRRFVVFATGIEQAEQLSPYVYHSKTSDVHYRTFKAGGINELASIKQIQEGANIPNLERGLVIQLDTNPLNMIQKLGRLLRREAGQLSSLFLLVFEQTFDESWCYKALAKTPKHKIHYHTLERHQYCQATVS